MKRSVFVLLGVAIFLLAGCTVGPHDQPRGWYFAGSKLEDKEAAGGFGPCDNFPKKCVNGCPGTAGQLSLVAYPDETVDFMKRKAMPLRLVNRTGEVVRFSACDSRLYIVQEALTSDGQWQALEKFPDTICGNSFHRVFLEPNEYWDFFALQREGPLKTKLRFRLEPEGEKGIAAGGRTLYSNEFEGSVDPAAFVRDPEKGRANR